MFLGNKEIIEYFEGLVKNDRLSHAYLFFGPEGVGKKTLAFKICDSLIGQAANNPDLKAISKGTDEIHISDIRDLKDFIHLTSFGKYKVVIINNVHNLGRDASNALLKILEEPPGKSVLFLITHLPKMLLPTITSRCQPVRFKPLNQKEIFNHLASDRKIKKETADSIAKMANGSLGLAVQLAESFDNFQKSINLLSRLIKADLRERFETAKKISSSSEDLKKVVGDWLIYSNSLPDKKISRELLELNNRLSRSQFNHKLFLDNFLIKL